MSAALLNVPCPMAVKLIGDVSDLSTIPPAVYLAACTYGIEGKNRPLLLANDMLELPVNMPC